MYQEDLDLLRSTRGKTLEMVENLTDGHLAFVPHPSIQPFELPFLPLRLLSPARPKWSIGEVLDHLYLFESVFRRDIAAIIELKKANRDPVLRLGFEEINVSFGFIPRVFLPFLELPVGVFSQIIPNELVEVLTRNRFLPAQNPDIANPSSGKPGKVLRKQLRDSLKETEALFEENSGLDYRNMFRQHPTTGRQNVLEALRMIALHEMRHQSQIREIRENRSFGR